MTVTLEAIRDRELEGEVAPLYSDTLAYHNFRHVLATLEAAEKILGRCIAEGIRVEVQVVYLALLFHDAGYHEDHLARGFACKEAYSAALARDALARRRISSHTIRRVEQAILSTRRDARFVTAEQKLVRAADLSGLSADYAVFLDNSRRLWREHQFLTQKPIAWSTWLVHAAENIRFYLSQEIRLTSYFVNELGESAFHAAASANLRRLLTEV